MSKQILIVLGILLVFGCADVSKENQLQTGCSGDSESTPENVYVAPAPAPAPTVTYWTKQFGTSSSDRGRGITSDSNGNIYVTGYTMGGLDGNTNTTGFELFVVKYNSSGTKQWTRQLGTFSRDYALADIVTDASNNIYITGLTQSSLDGNANAGSAVSWKDYSNDFFLVKYNSSGTKQWTRQLGTTRGDEGRSITIDSSSNVYVVGDTQGSLDGNTNAGNINDNSNNIDVFVVKYNSSGTKQWTQQLGTSVTDTGVGITSDSSGNVYVTGSTSGDLDGTNAGGGDVFVVKYNSSGTKQWTRQLGSSGSDNGIEVTSDTSGNVYVTGHTSAGLDGNTNSGGGSYDMVVVKYNSSGTKQWTRQLGSSNAHDFARDIAFDSNNNFYVIGTTSGGLDGNTSTGGRDLFVVKYNSSGIKQWTRQLGTSADDYGASITFGSSDYFYVTGYTSGSLDGNTSAGGEDVFIVKYDTDGNRQ